MQRPVFEFPHDELTDPRARRPMNQSDVVALNVFAQRFELVVAVRHAPRAAAQLGVWLRPDGRAHRSERGDGRQDEECRRRRVCRRCGHECERVAVHELYRPETHEAAGSSVHRDLDAFGSRARPAAGSRLRVGQEPGRLRLAVDVVDHDDGRPGKATGRGDGEDRPQR